MARIITCKACGKRKEHSAKGFCKTCYIKQMPKKIITCKACGRRKPHSAKGLCKTCYIKQMKGNIITCKDCGQEKKHLAKGLCATCYRRKHQRKQRDAAEMRERLVWGNVKKIHKETEKFTCPDCGRERKHRAKGLCETCYQKQRGKLGKKVTCKRCGRQRVHKAKGLCKSCYNMQYKQKKEGGETEREKVKKASRDAVKEQSDIFVEPRIEVHTSYGINVPDLELSVKLTKDDRRLLVDMTINGDRTYYEREATAEVLTYLWQVATTMSYATPRPSFVHLPEIPTATIPTQPEPEPQPAPKPKSTPVKEPEPQPQPKEVAQLDLDKKGLQTMIEVYKDKLEEDPKLRMAKYEFDTVNLLMFNGKLEHDRPHISDTVDKLVREATNGGYSMIQGTDQNFLLIKVTDHKKGPERAVKATIPKGKIVVNEGGSNKASNICGNCGKLKVWDTSQKKYICGCKRQKTGPTQVQRMGGASNRIIMRFRASKYRELSMAQLEHYLTKVDEDAVYWRQCRENSNHGLRFILSRISTYITNTEPKIRKDRRQGWLYLVWRG